MKKLLCLIFLAVGTAIFSVPVASSAKGSMEDDMNEPA